MVTTGFGKALRVILAPLPEEDPKTTVTCWLKAQARNPQEAVKKLRKQLLYTAVLLLREVVGWRPRLVVGGGRSGPVALLLGQPLVLEWACHFRTKTPMELGAFRQALPFAQCLTSVGPATASGLRSSII